MDAGSCWFTAREAAAYSRCSYSYMRRLISAGIVVGHKQGRGRTAPVLISREHLDRLIRRGGRTLR